MNTYYIWTHLMKYSSSAARRILCVIAQYTTVTYGTKVGHWVERRKEFLLSEMVIAWLTGEDKNVQAEKQGKPRKGEGSGLRPNVEYMAREKTRLPAVRLPSKKWTERKPATFCSAATKTCWELWNTSHHYEIMIENRSEKC